MTGIDKLEIIIWEVCDYFGVESSQLTTPCRKRKLVDARNTIFYFSLIFSDMSHDNIGKQFKRDHATVTHGRKTFQDLVKVNGFGEHQSELLRRIFKRLDKELLIDKRK